MMDAFVKRWGRAAALAFFALGFATFVMLTILLLVVREQIPGTEIGTIAAGYFWTMALIGGATQAPNMAERLPGARSWDRPTKLDGEQRRRTDESEAL